MRRIIKNKFNISVFFYVICAIMIVIIIPCAADIFEDMYRINGRMSGYEEDSLYQDFIDGSYDRLLEKTEYNIGMGKGIGKSISDDEQDYYTFADAYKKAIDYNVYVNKGEYAKAEQIVKDIDNTQFNNVLFKEVLEKVKNTYIFEF